MHHEKAYYTAFDLRLALANLHALRTTACAHRLLANMHILRVICYTSSLYVRPCHTQVSDQTHQGLGKVTLKSKHDENRKMLGAEWTGKQSVTVNPDRLVPMITDAQDAIIKVTSTAICGSDLHMYVGAMPGMTKGDLMGHEVSADYTCNRSCSPNRHALCS